MTRYINAEENEDATGTLTVRLDGGRCTVLSEDRKVVGYLPRFAEVLTERDDIEERLSAYLCDSTGGKLAKTGYDVRTMVTHTEEYYEGLHSEARKEIEAERDAALARNAKQREAMKRMKVQRRSNGRRAQKAEARIAEAAKLHQCFVMPNGFRWCSGCSTDEYPEDWPCPTAVALGLNEGGTDD